MFRSTPAALLCLMTAGCAVGQDPPILTGMVLVQTPDGFSYGPEQPCGTVKDGQLTRLVVSDELCDITLIKTLEATLPEPPAKVLLPAFYFDVHEVTNVQFEYCVAMGGCTADGAAQHTNNGPGQPDYYDSGDKRFDTHPVVDVTQAQAKQYCEWVGKRLPTEFEWERVAKGDGDTKRIFPLEKAPQALSDCGDLRIDTAACKAATPATQSAPVRDANGDYPLASQATDDYVLEGGVPVYHLFSNVAEWTSSLWTDKPTCAAPLPAGCTPAHLEEAALTSQRLCVGLCPSECGANWLPTGFNDTARCGDETDREQILSPSNDPTQATECFYRGRVTADGNMTASPICVAFDSAVSPADLNNASNPVNDYPVIKGGTLDIAEANGCTLTTWARNFFKSGKVEGRRRALNVGFRCALDGTEQPPTTYINVTTP